jgi:hypothetical protein
MLRIEKNWRQKNDFLNLLCRESENCTWQRNSLQRANQLALGKEIFGECFFCAESFLFGSRQRSLFAKCFSVPIAK